MVLLFVPPWRQIVYQTTIRVLARLLLAGSLAFAPAAAVGHAGAGMTRAKKAVIAGVVVGAGTASGLAISLIREDKAPISR